MSLFLANCSALSAPAEIPFESFSDDFEDGSMNEWWREGVSFFAPSGINPAVTVTETGGRMVVTPLTGVSGTNFNGWESAETQNFTGRAMTIRMHQYASDTNALVQTRIGFGTSVSNYAAFILLFTTLYMRTVTAGTVSDTTISFNLTNHRWLRLRMSGSDLLFETAPDGSTWTTRRTASSLGFGITAVRPALFAGSTGSVTTGLLELIVESFALE